MKTRSRSLLLALIVLTAIIGIGIGTASAYINMEVTTDKYIYNQGSLVTFTLKNTGTTSIWIAPTPVYITDITGNIVYDKGTPACGYVVCKWPVKLNPGGTYKWTWDQKTNFGCGYAYKEWCDSNIYQGHVPVYDHEETAYANYDVYNSNKFIVTRYNR